MDLGRSNDSWTDMQKRAGTDEELRPEDAGPGGREQAFLVDWAESQIYNPYRNYPHISAEQAARVLADAATEPGPGVTWLWHRHGSAPAGLIRIADLPWDTELYKRRMGRITHLCGELSSNTIRNLLDDTTFEHLAVRVDASDLATQRALTKAGFFQADSILTYLYHVARGALPEPPAGRSAHRYTFRQYEPTDREDILRVTRYSYDSYPGRYHADPWLRERSAERYLRWAEKCVDGEADQICVSESKGKVVGYVAFRYDRRLYRVLGLGCYGAGLGASRGGDYLRLLRYTLMCDKAIPWHFAECDTQIDNYAVHRIYHALKLDYVRAEYTYHWHRP